MDLQVISSAAGTYRLGLAGSIADFIAEVGGPATPIQLFTSIPMPFSNARWADDHTGSTADTLTAASDGAVIIANGTATVYYVNIREPTAPYTAYTNNVSIPASSAPQPIPRVTLTYTVGIGGGVPPGSIQSVAPFTINMPGQENMVPPAGCIFEGWLDNVNQRHLDEGQLVTFQGGEYTLTAQWAATSQDLIDINEYPSRGRTDLIDGLTRNIYDSGHTFRDMTELMQRCNADQMLNIRKNAAAFFNVAESSTLMAIISEAAGQTGSTPDRIAQQIVGMAGRWVRTVLP